jgi:hypothetical protein
MTRDEKILEIRRLATEYVGRSTRFRYGMNLMTDSEIDRILDGVRKVTRLKAEGKSLLNQFSVEEIRNATESEVFPENMEKGYKLTLEAWDLWKSL